MAVATSTTDLRATDGRLELRATFVPGTRMDRIPMRTIELTFTNVSTAPLRVYLPVPEEFRANISSIYLFSDAEGAMPLGIPTPRPHGYVITEADFFLLEPGATRTVTQSFTLDPMLPEAGTRTARRLGFENGRSVKVRWIYENEQESFPGGVSTFDGVTRPLFSGGPVPHLWTGELVATGTWTVSD